MGFWSGLGKGLLKVAPFAAMAIPGIGPVASAAIQAGLGAANAKASGGGLKDVLLGAGIGGATGGLAGGAGGAAKGLSPSKGFLSNLGTFAKQTGKNALTGLGGASTAGTGVKGMISQGMNALPGIMNAVANRNTSGTPVGTSEPAPPINTSIGTAPQYSPRSQTRYEGNMRGLGPVMGRRDQNFPNLAESIGAGRQEAIRNQPFRGGYDIVKYGPTEEEKAKMGPEIRTRMPAIGGNMRPRRALAQ